MSDMTPQSLNSQASDWGDVLLYGLSGAAVNAAYNLSDTVGYQRPVDGITIGTTGNILPLLVMAGLAYMLFSKG